MSGSPKASRQTRSPPERRSTEPGPSRLGGLFNSLFAKSAAKRTRPGPASGSAVHQHSTAEERDGPITAPGGWGSLLTWRGAAPDALMSTEPETLEQPTDVASQSRIHSRRSSSVDSHRGTGDVSGRGSQGGGRSRGAIPFDLSPSTATTGLPTSVAEEDDNEDHRYESPFASPSRKGRPRLALDALAAHLEDGSLPASPVVSPTKLQAGGDSAFEVERQLGADAYGTLSRLSHLNHRRSIPVLPRPSGAARQVGRSSMAEAADEAGFRRKGSLRMASAPARAWPRSSSDTSEGHARWDDKEGWSARERERVDECVRMCVTPAGVDNESRPMVVLSVCSLPDPKEVDYDHLFVRLMSALDLFVENDYIVILFASAGRHRPGWNWLWKAYKGLTRNYRKNLKRLYIVHPTLFTKTLVQFISTGSYFISPKFARKIVQCSTLAELGQHVPLQQIELPPEVLTHDLALTKGEEAKASFSTQEAGALDATKKVFGVPLEHLMGESGEYWSIPRVVKDSIEFLRHPLPGSEDTGELLMDTEGIFRRSPPSSLLRAAQMAYDGGHPVNLERYGDGPASAAHLAASLLKTFLRRLPSPLFPPSLYPLVKACPLHDPGENLADLEDTLEYIRSRLLPALAPPCKITLLATVCELLHDVAQRSQRNKMDAANLATVIAPNLVRGSDPLRDVAMCRVEGIGSMHSTVSNSGGKPQGPRPATLSRGATSTPDSNATDVKGPAGGDRTLGTVLRICVEHAYEIFPAAPVEPPMNTSYSDSIDGIISGAVTPAQPSSPSVTRNSARLPPLSTSVSTWTDSSASEGRPSSEHALLGLGLSAQTNGHSQKMSASQGDANVSPAGASEARGWARPRSGSASQPAGRASVEQSTRSAEPAQHEAGVHPSSTAARGASIRSVGGARSGEGGSYRGAGGGFGALGKSSAGSLRLTKGRLGSIGSGSSLRGASTLAATGAHANSIFAQGSPLGKTVQGDHAITPPMATGMVRYASTGSEGLTSSPSGVSLSGANASGLFSNSSASNSTLSSPVAKKGSSPAAHSATAVDDRSPLSARTSTPRTSASPSIMVGSTMDADVQPSLMTDATTTPLNSSIANTNRAPSAPGLSAGQPISRHLSASGGGRPLSEVVEHDDDHLE